MAMKKTSQYWGPDEHAFLSLMAKEAGQSFGEYSRVATLCRGIFQAAATHPEWAAAWLAAHEEVGAAYAAIIRLLEEMPPPIGRHDPDT